jgi:hypothetical protein
MTDLLLSILFTSTAIAALLVLEPHVRTYLDTRRIRNRYVRVEERGR